MTSSINGLDSNFTSLISNLMAIERQPLQRLTAQRDTITTQKAIYSDMGSMLNTFQSSVKTLISGNAYYDFKTGYKTQVSGIPSGATVLTASASSTAAAGTFDISIESLAAEHRIRSDKLTTWTPMSGSFQIGLGGTSSQETKTTVDSTLSGFGISPVTSDQGELGTGAYYVETRQDASLNWQFRLVDQSGKQVAINNSADGDWQSMPTASGDTVQFDTGRGLTIAFGTNPDNYKVSTFNSAAHPPAQVNYSAAYATINVTDQDTLSSIASKINQAAFPTDKRVSAAVVDSQLVLSGGIGGDGNLIVLKDGGEGVLKKLGVLDNSGSVKYLMQPPKNAVFYVNDLRVERSRNTNLTDVISGVTLNLASDAKINKTATLDITRDGTKEIDTVNAFIKNFNSTVSYFGAKLATVKQADGTYTRGALAGDHMFMNLRQDLIGQAAKSYVNGGLFHSLRDIGIEMDNSFQLSIKDSAKFEKALQNKSDLTAFLDQFMTQVNDRLSRYTGSSGYVLKNAESLDKEYKATTENIGKMNKRLAAKQDALVDQYAQLQSQLYMMSYTQQTLSAIYGSTNTTA